MLAIAKRSGVAFEWADHIAAAKGAGLPQAVIEAVAGATDVPSPFDIVTETMDCAFAYRSIPSGLQDQIVQRFGLKGLIEIVSLCGFYTLIGMVNAGFDVPLPPQRPASA